MSSNPASYVVDTNVFNHLLDGILDILELDALRGKLYITHVQHDELLSTKDIERRSGLLSVFQAIETIKIATESAIWDVSRWDEAKWGTGGFHEIIKQELDKKHPGKSESNVRDALIAEAAIVNEYTLITNDQALIKITKKLGGKTLDLKGKK